MEREVKNCPFCGSDEGFLTVMVYDRNIFSVKCCECGAESGKCETEKEAIEAWNRRNLSE